MPFKRRDSNAPDAVDNIIGIQIRERFGRGLTPKGDIGIEIEVEGNRAPTNTPKQWQLHPDRSLRGAWSGEFVLNGPMPFDEAMTALDDLWAALGRSKVQLDDSNRTSVHVHLNVNEFYLDRLAAFAGLWFTFEDILVNWCGEYRVGNLFCLRAKDARHIITQLEMFFGANMGSRLPDRLHYSAFNPNAIEKFGSIEIRSLRGTTDLEVIKLWIEVLRKIYEASEDFQDNPRNVCARFSDMGPDAFYRAILEEPGERLRAGLGWSDDDIAAAMWEGTRFAQDIVFSVEWERYKRKPEEKVDPFGRPKETSRTRPRGRQFGGDPVAGQADPLANLEQLLAENRANPLFNEAEIVVPRRGPAPGHRPPGWGQLNQIDDWED